MRLKPLSIAAACAGLLALAPPAIGQDEAEGDDPVVAEVNGEPIRYSEVMASAQSLPQQYRQRIKEIFPALVDRLIDLRLLEQQAKAAGLADDPEVEERLAALKPQVMRDVFLQRRIEDYVTEARLDEAYAQYKKDNPAKTEVRARHILLESEDAAEAVIEELDDGADFVELAEERSTGPSAGQGGDLGYFTEEEMVPAFSAAAFALEPGDYSTEPVETQFGWHVILVEDRRTQQVESREEVEADLREDLQRQAVESLLADLRAEAEVEKYPEAQKLEPQDGGGAGGAE